MGAIPLGAAAVGRAVSLDGRWLYATSESAVRGQLATQLIPSEKCAGRVPGTGAGEPPGTLTVIDLPGAETDPAHSVVATVAAGYQPVRVVTSADGTLLVSDFSSGQVQAVGAATLPASVG